MSNEYKDWLRDNEEEELGKKRERLRILCKAFLCPDELDDECRRCYKNNCGCYIHEFFEEMKKNIEND